MSDNLTPKQKATLATWGLAVDDNGVVRSNAAVGPLDARIAKLEAELAEANIAVGLTGYDHREDVATPAQCIYALWADHTNICELHAMQEAAITSLEAELAAAREREAALAAALKKARDLAATAASYEVDAALSTEEGTDVFGSAGIARKSLAKRAKNAWAEFDAITSADPAPILARVRREAKREDLRKVKAAAEECIKVMLFESSGRHDRVSRDSYCEGVQDVIADIDAALAALDAEEKTS